MGSDTTHVAQTGLFFDVNEAKIAAKIGRVARGEPTSPTKSLKTQKLMLAERVGFEPTCPLRDKTLSRRPRYDHFGTSPVVCGRPGQSQTLLPGPAKAGHYVDVQYAHALAGARTRNYIRQIVNGRHP